MSRDPDRATDGGRSEETPAVDDPDGPTYYEVLEVSPQADQSTISRAFRHKIKQCHPDRNEGPNAEERFQRVLRAKEVLLDPHERERYDQLGHAEYISDREERDRRDGQQSNSATIDAERSADGSGGVYDFVRETGDVPGFAPSLTAAWRSLWRQRVGALAVVALIAFALASVASGTWTSLTGALSPTGWFFLQAVAVAAFFGATGYAVWRGLRRSFEEGAEVDPDTLWVSRGAALSFLAAVLAAAGSLGPPYPWPYTRRLLLQQGTEASPWIAAGTAEGLADPLNALAAFSLGVVAISAVAIGLPGLSLRAWRQWAAAGRGRPWLWDALLGVVVVVFGWGLVGVAVPLSLPSMEVLAVSEGSATPATFLLVASITPLLLKLLQDVSVGLGD